MVCTCGAITHSCYEFSLHVYVRPHAQKNRRDKSSRRCDFNVREQFARSGATECRSIEDRAQLVSAKHSGFVSWLSLCAFLKFALQGAAGDVENSRGVRDVAITVSQHLLNVVPLGFRQ